MEHLDGFAWGNAAGMRAAGIDTAAVLRSSLIAFLEGALLYGVFHGDLHGGNLLVQSDGTVALLDFGITGRLDERKRLAFLRLQMGATTNNLAVQVEALRDLGALPADSDVEAVIRDLGLDRPPVDPTTLTADEMVAELRDVTKALLGYGARMPKELMLFVKDILFLNGAMATMAPDVDILGEILAVVTYFTEHHGEQIAREVGAELLETPIDLDGYRAAMGFPDETDPITFQDLQERRDLIRRRLQDRNEPRSRLSLARPSTGSCARIGVDDRRNRSRSRPGRLPAPSLRTWLTSRTRDRHAASRARRREDTNAAAPSGPAPSSSRRTRAEPTTTPSATSHTVAACSGVETPIPTQTGSWVAPTTRSATCRAESASTACSPVTPIRPTA